MGRSYTHDITDIMGDAEAGLQSAVLAGGGDYLENWSGREPATG